MAQDDDPTNSTQPEATPRAKLSGSEFIRQQPGHMSVPDVVAKGEAEGIRVSADLVRTVRRNAANKKARTRKPASGKPAPSSRGRAGQAPAPRASRPANPPHKPPSLATKPAPAGKFKGTKIAFVLRHPRSTPAAELADAARAQGVDLSPAQIHSIRSKARRKKQQARSTRSEAARGEAPALPSPSAPRASASPKKAAPAPAKAAVARPTNAPAPAQRAAAHDTDEDHAAFFGHVVRMGLTRAEALLAIVKERLRELTRGR